MFRLLSMIFAIIIFPTVTAVMRAISSMLLPRRSNHGVILIVLACFLPLVMLGIRYSEQLLTLKEHLIKKTDDTTISKHCAQGAALEVARRWNPALTLAQQKESMLRIADNIYNINPAYHNSVLGHAVPGLITRDANGNPISLDASIRTVSYKTVKSKKKRMRYYRSSYYSSYESSGRFWLYHMVATSATRNPLFSEDDYIEDVAYNDYYSYTFFTTRNEHTLTNYGFSSNSSTDEKEIEYSTRSDPSDSKVQLSIENDRIKVSTDSYVGYAVPAKCNVDIIMSIPTNTAACDQNCYDGATSSTSSGWRLSSSASTYTTDYRISTAGSGVTSSPIYQIAQAYRTFLKDNFEYTRGVNVALIPYSGKVAIAPGRSGWCTNCYAFIETNYDTYPTSYPRKSFKPVFLYGAYHGGALTSQNNSSVYWGQYYGGFSLLYRLGYSITNSTYGNNYIVYGDLLSTTDPSSRKFQKRPGVVPINADLLHGYAYSSLTDYANPYYIIELTSDVSKMRDILNVIWPYYSPYNTSNFIFIPLTWANNLLQTWTSDPYQSAVATSANQTTGGNLSTQEKRADGRKKALILIVNKPDHFEPNEMTYLGLSHDYIDYPMYDSDKIYFDNSRTGVKGNSLFTYTAVSGTHSTINGHYTASGSCTGRLNFGYRGLIKLVIDRYDGASGTTENSGTKTIAGSTTYTFSGGSLPTRGQSYTAKNSSGGKNFESNLSIWKVRYSLVNAKITACTLSNQILRNYSGMAGYKNTISRLILNDGTEATRSDVNKSFNSQTIFGNTSISSLFKFCDSCVTFYQNTLTIAHSTNYLDFLSPTISNPLLYKVWGLNKATVYLEHGEYTDGVAMYTDNNTTRYTMSGYNSWDNFSQATVNNPAYFAIYTTTSNTNGWSQAYFLNSTSKSLITSGTEGDVASNVGIVLLKDQYGNDWICFQGDGELKVTVQPIDTSKTASITFYDDNRQTSAPTVTSSSTLKFKDVTGDTATHTITGITELYVEPANITTGSINSHSISFDMNNIRLISAEITNRPYTKITPTISMSGSTVTLNCKRPFKITAAAPSISCKSLERSVTFSKVDSSAPLQYTGTYSLNPGDSKSFTFSKSSNFCNYSPISFYNSEYGANYHVGDEYFGGLYGEEKIKYSVKNVSFDQSTSKTNLRRQELRCNYQRPTQVHDQAKAMF